MTHREFIVNVIDSCKTQEQLINSLRLIKFANLKDMDAEIILKFAEAKVNQIYLISALKLV